MQLAAKDRGFDMSKLRARQITIADFKDFDLIVAMDKKNLSSLQKLCPNKVDKVYLLTDYSLENLEYNYVPDPYYTRNFSQALDIIETSLSGLVRSLKTIIAFKNNLIVAFQVFFLALLSKWIS